MGGRITYLVVIAILIAFISYLLGRDNPNPPIVPTPAVVTILPSPLQPSPTFVVPTPFPTPFIPQFNQLSDGGSQLRTVVDDGGDISSIASVLQRYEWIIGQLDVSPPTALYLYDNAWVRTT